MHLTNPKVFGFCGVVSTLLFWVADRMGAALRPGYSSKKQAISELIETGAPNKKLLDILILSYHALVIPFSYGLHRGIPPVKGSRTGPMLLAGAGTIGVILTAFFPCDRECKPVTVRGIMHIILAIPMGFMILFAILAFSRRLEKDNAWPGYDRYSRITFFAGSILAVITVALAKTPVGGFLERMLTASYQQWYVVMGMSLIRKNRISMAPGHPV